MSLETQRADVDALTRTLAADAGAAVAATVREAHGRWEGCRSAFPETYASYRYVARVRLDAAPATCSPRSPRSVGGAPGPGRAGPAARQPRRRSSTPSGRCPEDSQGDLLLTVRGPCVDVPEGERDAWRARLGESTDPLAR